jgi:Cu(I)-responsive transcriptional regulator
MNIGAAARASGVSAKMIRHYEEIGLIPRTTRSGSGYRVYGENDVHTLRFVRRARDLGFPIGEIRKLLGLWRNRSRSSAAVKKLALEHVRELEEKIDELRTMAEALKSLARRCRGDDRPECPILRGLTE